MTQSADSSEKLKKIEKELKVIETNVPAIKLLRTPRWERSYSVEGHKPKWEIRCWHCAFKVRKPWDAIKWIWYYFTDRERVKGMPMAIRHGNASYASDTEGANIMSYKCPRCAWFISFYVVDDADYITKIIKDYRGGENKFVPLCDDWSDESEEIGRQLAALGYWGGRD